MMTNSGDASAGTVNPRLDTAPAGGDEDPAVTSSTEEGTIGSLIIVCKGELKLVREWKDENEKLLKKKGATKEDYRQQLDKWQNILKRAKIVDEHDSHYQKPQSMNDVDKQQDQPMEDVDKQQDQPMEVVDKQHDQPMEVAEQPIQLMDVDVTEPRIGNQRENPSTHGERGDVRRPFNILLADLDEAVEFQQSEPTIKDMEKESRPFIAGVDVFKKRNFKLQIVKTPSSDFWENSGKSSDLTRVDSSLVKCRKETNWSNLKYDTNLVAYNSSAKKISDSQRDARRIEWTYTAHPALVLAYNDRRTLLHNMSEDMSQYLQKHYKDHPDPTFDALGKCYNRLVQCYRKGGAYIDFGDRILDALISGRPDLCVE